MKSKVIGKGSYGCVLKPHVKCDETKSDDNKDLVGKVFDNERNYKGEVDIMNNIEKITKEKHVIKKCKISMDDPENVKTLKECDFASNDLKTDVKTLSQIVYKYKGRDLSKVTISDNSFKKVFLGLEGFLGYLKKIHDSKHQHMDIKLENVVFDGKKLHLIDYSLLMKNSEIYDSTKRGILRFIYNIYPPEFKMYVYKTKATVLSKIKENYDKELWESIETLGANADFASVIEKSTTRNVFIPEKIDVFSLGITLLDFYSRTPGFYIRYKRKCKSMTFHEQVKQMLRVMIDFDPEKRADIDGVISIYREISNLFSSSSS
jgi:serine/threonine protein kinase